MYTRDQSNGHTIWLNMLDPSHEKSEVDTIQDITQMHLQARNAIKVASFTLHTDIYVGLSTTNTQCHITIAVVQ